MVGPNAMEHVREIREIVEGAQRKIVDADILTDGELGALETMIAASMAYLGSLAIRVAAWEMTQGMEDTDEKRPDSEQPAQGS